MHTITTDNAAAQVWQQATGLQAAGRSCTDMQHGTTCTDTVRGTLLLRSTDLVLLELLDHVIEQRIVKVLSSEEGVTIRSFDLKHSP